MARKPRSTKSTAQKDADPLVRILDAAMNEAAATGWHHLSFEAIARRAEMTLGKVLTHVPTQSHLLARFADHVDHAAFSAIESVDHDQSVKDRLFDVIMRRLDVLQKHRSGVLAMMKGVMAEPGAAAMLLARLSRSMTATMTAAGLSPHGLSGLVQMMGLKAVYLSTLRAWRADASADMTKTMAALNRALGYAEQAANFSNRFARRNNKASQRSAKS